MRRLEMEQANEQIVTITEKAAVKAKQLMEKENKKDFGLRVGVVAGGCSAYMYQIEFEKGPKENDTVLEQHGIRIFINQESAEFMKGSTVDYKDTLQNAGFDVKNPNVKSKCGCGHSVS
jgi:iron-sulfur cluster assembly accessory protein